MKIVIIVLILIAVVFVIFVTRGSLTSDQPKRGSRSDAADFTRQKKAPDWSRTVKKILGGLGKKLSLDCGETDPECLAIPLDKNINISSENGTSFRTVTFVLVKGRARIQYRDRTDKAADLKLK